MKAEKKEKSFVIKDKRIFDESGDVRKETETLTQEKPLETKAEKAQQPPVEESQEPPTEEYLPEMNFANFVLSLSTTAMYHFGDFPDPVSRKAEKNLIAAKQTIDILGLLQTKTEGNLDENEKSLLDGLLFELRMRYVKEKGSP
jgi:DNA-nicking Smr family endonuclease